MSENYHKNQNAKKKKRKSNYSNTSTRGSHAIATGRVAPYEETLPTRGSSNSNILHAHVRKATPARERNATLTTWYAISISLPQLHHESAARCDACAGRQQSCGTLGWPPFARPSVALPGAGRRLSELETCVRAWRHDARPSAPRQVACAASALAACAKRAATRRRAPAAHTAQVAHTRRKWQVEIQ